MQVIFMEFFPVSVFLVFHLDDDNGRKTDRQADKKTRVAFFRVVNTISEGQSGHYCVSPRHDMSRNSIPFCATASANRLQIYHRKNGK